MFIESCDDVSRELFDVCLTCFQYDRLKRRNEELSERADTAEFQVGTISQEYRKLLQQKEVCNSNFSHVLYVHIHVYVT